MYVVPPSYSSLTEVRAAGGTLYFGGTFGGTLQLASAGLIGYTPAETLFRDSFE